MNIQSSNLNFSGKVPSYKKVDSYLFRGSRPSVSDLFSLKKEGVTQIYDFRHDNYKGFKFVEKLLCKYLGIDYHRMKFSFFDEAKKPKLDDFETVATSIKEVGMKGGKTLLHCNSGHHRTGLMAAFYDITRGETLENAKKIYPKTFGLRVEAALNGLKNREHYFDRTIITEFPLNPIKRSIAKYNNRAAAATAQAFEDFRELLLK